MASITKYGNGKWRCRIIKVGHAPISDIFEKKSEAEKWAREQETKMSKGESLDPSLGKGLTVAELFQNHIEKVIPAKPKKGEEDPNKGERNTAKRLLSTAEFMNRRVNQIRPADIEEWTERRLREIQPASVTRELTTISSVFTQAIKTKRISIQNPVVAEVRPKDSDVRREIRWTEKDIQKMLKASGFKSDARPAKTKDYVGWALLVAVETAMRVGEICKLKVSDFHPDQRMVYLARTKNGDPRKVPLSKNAMGYFELLTAERDPGEKIFPPVGSLGVYFREVRKAAGLSDNLRFHDMRHEAATRLSQKFPNVLELAAMTGHRSLKSLQRYYNPTTLEMAARLDA